MKPFEKFFYSAGDVRLGNYNVAVQASPSEGRALARALHGLVAKHCGVTSNQATVDEHFMKSFDDHDFRQVSLVELAVRRVLDTGGD